MFSIDKKVIGSQKNLIFKEDQSIEWSNTLLYDGVTNGSFMEDFLLLYDIDIDEVFDKRYRNSMSYFQVQNVPWRYVIPRDVWFESIKNFTQKIFLTLDQKQSKEYLKFFKETNVVNAFSKPDISFLTSIENKPQKLQTFIEKYYLDELSYIRSSHKTGRLTVSSGPNYLTLDKKYRSLLRPTHKNNLISIDLISLEPRTLMLVQKMSPLKDVYLSIINDLGLSNSERSKVKIYTLSCMYAKEYSANGRNLKSTLTKYFNLRDFKNQLLSSVQRGVMTNFFGRPIRVEDNEKCNVVNYYIQSSSADVSLFCFSNLIKRFNIDPVCIIHDELICEVDDEELQSLQQTDHIDVPKLGKFYYDVDLINKKVI